MKLATSILALMLIAAPVFAATAPWSNIEDINSAMMQKNLHLSGNIPNPVPHVGGDNIGSATPIASLPFSDTGNTCSYIDDYDVSCPYTGSTSGDVVYSFSPAANMSIDIDLCASGYDTKVYVFDGSPATVVACNDDAGCGMTGYQSALTSVALLAGHTYYVVVDGYFGDCGDYDLYIAEHVPCAPCAVTDQNEGEPDCYTDYVDSYNGGCNSTPNVFTEVTCPDICATTGTYAFGTSSYRDTDWYTITVGAGTFTYTGIADGFGLQLLVISPAACPATIIGATTAASCSPAVLSFDGPGTFYLWAGPSSFSGVACGSTYHLNISGPGIVPCEPTATHPSSWGRLKAIYR